MKNKNSNKIICVFIIFIMLLNILIPVMYATNEEIANNVTTENTQNQNISNENSETENANILNNINSLNTETIYENNTENTNLENKTIVNNSSAGDIESTNVIKQVTSNLKSGEQTVANGTYEIVSSKDTNKLLTVENNSNVAIWTDINSKRQKFQVTYLEDGYYKIQVLDTEQVLDVCGGHKENGTNVQVYESNGTDAQQWIIKDEGNEEYSLVSKSNNLNLDIQWGVMSNGTNVQMYEENGSNAQKFKFNKIDVIEGAQTIEDGQYYIEMSKDQSKVLEATNNSNIQIGDKTKQDNQKFQVTYIKDGYYKLEIKSSGKVLDVNGGDTFNSTNVQEYCSNGTSAQKWIIKDEGNGEYSILSWKSELYLDVAGGKTTSGTNVQIYEGNGTEAQRFIFTKTKKYIGSKTIEDGVYKIQSALDNNMVLDIAGGSLENGANAQIWSDSNVKQQAFYLKYIGDGYYTIRPFHSKKSLDVDNASDKLGTNVKQFEFYGADAQQWIIKDIGDGYYNIISKCNDLCLDIDGANSENGTNVQMYSENGTNAQKFKFEATNFQSIDNGIYRIKMSKDQNKVLDIDSGSIENGANVQIWSEDDVNQQKFVVTYNETTKDYIIQAVHSNKVLDVYCGSSENGTNVQQYDSNGSNAQRWKIQDLGDGTYNIISNCGGLYLDVAGGRTDKGTNVQIYEGNGTQAQAFVFEQTKVTVGVSFTTLDESKYPGYKTLLQQVQNQHPNWKIKVMYTGLNWDTVIEQEDQIIGGSPKSLIYDSYTNEWIQGTEKYDVNGRWYRASQKAIAYMMDPRQSLTEKWIFQFQDISLSYGTVEEISKMTEGTFLHTDELINAIVSIAQEKGISPFHLVSRILQEQGKNGTGALNGYDYYGTKVYNLFNINVSGNTTVGILAGARKAYEEGWFTQVDSIRGGAELLKTGYLNKGQITLYYEKYNIANSNNLYNNQYMQNIRAANDEGNVMYQAYLSNDLVNSSFEFVIPVYEGMPSEVSPVPSK